MGGPCFNPSIGLTSVPTLRDAPAGSALKRGFNPSIGLTSVPTLDSTRGEIVSRAVSIPQSGLQAFRPIDIYGTWQMNESFQSLNRAYKRSDGALVHRKSASWRVSIPQSGLQAFRQRMLHDRQWQRSCFNPSIGLTSVPTPPGR